VVNNNAKLYANLEEGFVGIGLKKDDGGEFISDCSDLSEIIVIGKDGKYRITKVSDKAFFGKNLLYVGVFNRNDARTIYNVIYRDGKSPVYYAKRFNVTSVTRDKEYDITTGAPGSAILWFTVNHNGEAETVRIYLRPKPKLKKTQLEYDFSTLGIKGKASRGNLVSKNSIQKIVMKSKGVSTIGGKDIWYDADVQRLNEDGRGIHLGEFSGEDRVLAIFKDGTYYTTNYETVNKYQGEVLRIEKLDIGKTWTALYWDAGAKAFYIKRFSFTESNNSPVSFIAEGRNSYLVDIADDLHPQVVVTFGGKYAHREPEIIDAEEYIAKKGLTAKGKKCHAYDLSKVEFTEPLHKPEDDVEPQEEEVIDIDIDVTEEDDTPAATPSAGSGPAPIEQTGQAGKLLEENPDDDDVEPIELTLF
ncbi:MAG: DNA gyrase/topoisomerase IV subunit A, partial [Bacteroidales bacterium]|nr:DNA gyrase/topoisomerase IV subunit A [Bacteroidales bacterium]